MTPGQFGRLTAAARGDIELPALIEVLVLGTRERAWAVRLVVVSSRGRWGHGGGFPIRAVQW